MHKNKKSNTKYQKFDNVLSVFFILFLLFFILAAPTHAQIPSSPLQGGIISEIFNVGRTAAGIGIGERALADLDLQVAAFRIVSGALMIVGLIFIILVMYGGFLYMTSGGNEEQTGKAKKILARTVIGVAIILSSYGIVDFFNRRIQRAIFEDMLTQVQSCATAGTGVATCCQQWNDFQNSLTVAGADPNPRSEELYRQWQQCYGQALESTGLPGAGQFR